HLAHRVFLVFPARLPGGLRSGFAGNQLRLHGNLQRVFLFAFNSRQQNLSCGLSNVPERLPYGGQTRILICRTLDIVESDYRNVLRHSKAGLLESPNCTNRRNIIEREEGGEWAFSLQESFCGAVT